MKKMRKFLQFITCITIASFAAVIIGISGAYLYLAPNLPDVDTLIDIKLQTPLRIYSSDHQLLGEFGDKRRTPVSRTDVPEKFIQAFLAAEDDQFFTHIGVTAKGLGRAIYQKVIGSAVQTGGSTITMQVAKNYFLTPEKSIIRKIREIFLALEMEKKLTKDQILELYINKIFLGHRSYGIVAAAHVYYGKPIDELNTAQIAMIAALPKAPSSTNPISNPEKAKIRRDWILRRMMDLGFISDEEYQTSKTAPITAEKHQISIDIYAPYVAEMARKKAVELFGQDAYTDGYRLYTTVKSNLQTKAQSAVQNGLQQYDQRHGYRKLKARVEEMNEENKSAFFNEYYAIRGIKPAIVTNVEDKQITIEFADESSTTIKWEAGLETARAFVSENQLGPVPKKASDIFVIGDTLYASQREDESWQLDQLPRAEASLVSLNPHDGAILALVGGFDFFKSKFNRATQSKRQVGSTIKPLIYSAALENGMTAASMINDAPVVFEDATLESTWRPKNSGDFLGPIRLRQALYKSKNLVSVRILQQLGVSKARDYLTNFGLDKSALPRDLSLSLGSPTFTPLTVATAYAAIANGGFKIEPFIVSQILDNEENIVYEADPAYACDPCGEPKVENEQEETTPEEIEEAASLEELAEQEETEELPIRQAQRVMDERVAFIMTTILQDVIRKGTGYKASALKRPDLAGKTGTTNGPTDAWFSGFNKDIVTTSWLGFDDNSKLGVREYGGTAALPIWIDFMQEALKNIKVSSYTPPPGIVNVLIDKESGKRANPGQANAMFEYIQEELVETIAASEDKQAIDPINLDDIF